MTEGAKSVLVVGGGFAGVACARRLAKDDRVTVRLIDQRNYSQFQPLLYQVATSQLASGDVASPLRTLELRDSSIHVVMGEVAEVDPGARAVTLASGERHTADAIVVAAGARPNFFNVPGAEEHAYPLYSLADALALRSRIIALFEGADRDPSLVEKGALTFVIVGGGPTGTEMAGALAEMIHGTLAGEFRSLAVSAAKVILVDHGHAVLAPFKEEAHAYAAKVLQRDGVQLRLGTGVVEVGPGHVTLSDGAVIPTRCVVWGGGIQAASVASVSGLPVGRGGRIVANADLTVGDLPGVYAVGDIAQIPAPDGSAYPQLGSVAQQSGAWAAGNILADLDGKPRKPFHYHDKGIMAMIGRNAAVAEVGHHRHELTGAIAFAAWMGVHVALLSGFRNRIDAFVDWGWDYFSKARTAQLLDRTDEARIDWGDDEAVSVPTPAPRPEPATDPVPSAPEPARAPSA